MSLTTSAVNHAACDKVIAFSLKLFVGKHIKCLACKHNNKEAGPYKSLALVGKVLPLAGTEHLVLCQALVEDRR